MAVSRSEIYRRTSKSLDPYGRRARVLMELAGQPLSAREIQVLYYAAQGQSSKTIGSRLGLTASGISYVKEVIFLKLQVPSITAAVATAIRRGIIK